MARPSVLEGESISYAVDQTEEMVNDEARRFKRTSMKRKAKIKIKQKQNRR